LRVSVCSEGVYEVEIHGELHGVLSPSGSSHI
jgi:hypothetical protein